MGGTAARNDPKGLIHEVCTREIAHMSLDEAVADFPVGEINTKPPNVSCSFWHILEHIRIGQWDLLEYVENPELVSPDIFAPVPFADDRSVVRCAFLALGHNAYHLGELAVLRQVMQLWPKDRKG